MNIWLRCYKTDQCLMNYILSIMNFKLQFTVNNYFGDESYKQNMKISF